VSFIRYAIYYVPPVDAGWAQLCTNWLGWDVNSGRTVAQADVADLPLPISEITQAPRRYGLHATLKPPFRLASDQTEAALKTACAALASDQETVQLQSLAVSRLGRFLALCPSGPTEALNTLAARCVSELDLFRAPATPDELDRRRGSGLSVRQDHNLTRWGYPHVMDLFQFHITLTGRLPKNTLASVETALTEILATHLPEPLHLNDLALVGEDGTGHFHLIRRYPLTG
jgi:putative phosphonate metabolism protein